MGATDMMQGWLQLLKQPAAYFEAFENAAPSWRVAYVGFYLVSFVEAVGNRVFGNVSASPGAILGRSLLSALGAAFLNAAVFGIVWFWVGSKLVGGKASLAATTKACGYAFLYPSILGLLTVPWMLQLSGSSVESAALTILGIMAVQFIAGLWAFVMALLAVKHLNGFGWGRTLIVAIWFPGLAVALVFGTRAFV